MKKLFYWAAVVSAMLVASIASAGPATAFAPDGSVTLPEPEVACDRVANQFIVRWTVENSTTQDIRISQVALLIDGSVRPGNLPPIAVGAIVPASGRLSADQRVPSTSTTVGLRLVLTDAEGVETVVERSVELTGDCAPPGVRFETNCANEVVVTVTSVAKTGDAQVTVRAAGGFSQSVRVEPQGSATVTVPAANAAGEIGVFLVDSNAEREVLIATGFRTPRTDCGPTLPVTGAPAAGLLAGGLAILATGTVLLVSTVRRRRIRFTA